MRRALPAYLDAFIAAARSGAPLDNIHLGHWDEPTLRDGSVPRGSFTAAQDRLTDVLLDLLEAQPTDRILDVACGVGGALRRLAAQRPQAVLHGLNLDARQIALCRRSSAQSRTAPSWTVADATQLPYAPACFDRVLCIEAQFHFASRRAFLAEVGRVLRVGGVFVVSDILLRRPAGDAQRARIEAVLDRDYGPWPEKWATAQDVIATANAFGLTCAALVDATRHTFPSWAFIAPHDRVAAAAVTLRQLHAGGDLGYVYFKFVRVAGA